MSMSKFHQIWIVIILRNLFQYQLHLKFSGLVFINIQRKLINFSRLKIFRLLNRNLWVLNVRGFVKRSICLIHVDIRAPDSQISFEYWPPTQQKVPKISLDCKIGFKTFNLSNTCAHSQHLRLSGRMKIIPQQVKSTVKKILFARYVNHRYKAQVIYDRNIRAF